MSSMSFENLRNEHPDLNEIWNALEAYFQSGRDIDTRDLARISGANLFEVGKALAILVSEEWVTIVYRIEAPDGTFVGDKYEALTDLPSSSWDRFYQSRFDVDPEENVIPIYSPSLDQD